MGPVRVVAGQVVREVVPAFRTGAIIALQTRLFRPIASSSITLACSVDQAAWEKPHVELTRDSLNEAGENGAQEWEKHGRPRIAASKQAS